jgi:hypothetical protein
MTHECWILLLGWVSFSAIANVKLFKIGSYVGAENGGGLDGLLLLFL